MKLYNEVNLIKHQNMLILSTLTFIITSVSCNDHLFVMEDKVYSFMRQNFKSGSGFLPSSVSGIPNKFATFYLYDEANCAGSGYMDVFGNACTNGEFTSGGKDFKSQRIEMFDSDPSLVMFDWEVFTDTDCQGTGTAGGVFGGYVDCISFGGKYSGKWALSNQFPVPSESGVLIQAFMDEVSCDTNSPWSGEFWPRSFCYPVSTSLSESRRCDPEYYTSYKFKSVDCDAETFLHSSTNPWKTCEYSYYYEDKSSTEEYVTASCFGEETKSPNPTVSPRTLNPSPHKYHPTLAPTEEPTEE